MEIISAESFAALFLHLYSLGY